MVWGFVGVKHQLNTGTVYILVFFFQKGFPLDATLDDIKEWLDRKGKVESIQMRRSLLKKFKVTPLNQTS